MTQEFLLERKFHFNLRKPKGNKPTQIYFVVTIGGKQYKLTTSVKVYPDQWDNTLQVAIVSNTNSKLDNRNNKIANERLEQIKTYYSEFIAYLCSQEKTPTDLIGVLKTYIYKDMVKKTPIDINVVKTIQDAFNYYYTNISQVKDSTLIQCEKNLKRFTQYIGEKNLTNNVDVFSQVGLNAYKAYLIELMDNGKIGKAHINALCQLIERLINNVLVVNNEYQQYKLTPVKYVKIEDKRQQDEIRRFPLYDNEVQAIKDCTTLTDKEREYRTIFLLQCASGQRISDILQILKGNYEEKDGVITLQTIKKGTYSQIYITDEISGYLKEVRDIRFINLDKFDDNLYNKALKDICKKANLNRVIKWKDSRGNAHSNMLWEIVVSHDARHTFATNKVKEGVPYETICLMTGHADDRMIKEVYANLTKEDKRDKVKSYYEQTDITVERLDAPATDICIKDVLQMTQPDKEVSIYEFDTDLINEDILDSLLYNKAFIDMYELNESDIQFLSKAHLPNIEVGYHSLPLIKQLKRLMERGFIICTYKGTLYPELLKDVKVKTKFCYTPRPISKTDFQLKHYSYRGMGYNFTAKTLLTPLHRPLHGF